MSEHRRPVLGAQHVGAAQRLARVALVFVGEAVIGVDRLGVACKEVGGGNAGARPGAELDTVRGKGLLGMPPGAADHHEGVIERDHADHAGTRFERCTVEAAETAAEDRGDANRGVDGAGMAHVCAEMRTAIDLGRDVGAGHGAAEQTAFGRIAEHDTVRWGECRGLADQRTEGECAAGRGVHDPAIAHLEFAGRHVEPRRRGACEHVARGRAGRAHRQPGVTHAGAAAGHLHAEHARDPREAPAYRRRDEALVVGVERRGISEHGNVAVDLVDRRLLGAHVPPGGAELLGDQHRQRGVHPLAHFGAGHGDRDAPRGIDLEPGIERDLVALGRQDAGIAEQFAFLEQPVSDQQSAADDTGGEEKTATSRRELHGLGNL